MARDAKQGPKDGITLRLKATGEGRQVQYARFTVPFKLADGQIVWERVERSTRVADAKQAREIAKGLREAEIKACFEGKPAKAGKTFAEAVVLYIKKHGGPGSLARYLKPLLLHIGHTPLESIDEEFVIALAGGMLPDAKASTQNTCVFTPVIAVLHANETKTWHPPKIARPKGALPPTNWKQPPKHWWKAVVDHAPPHIGALVLFLRLHGRRLGEALAIEPKDVEREGDVWTVHVRDTKCDQSIILQLAAPVVEQLKRYDWWAHTRIFGYTNPSGVYPRIKQACERAGVPYHCPKDIGRHEFASALLRSGKTLMEVKEAGRWKSIHMPARTYGHLEHRAVDAEARALGEEWFSDQQEKGAVAPLKRKGEKE